MHAISATQPRRAALPLAAYPHHAADTVRLGDLDHQNHVNNAVYATYFETGRVMLLHDTLGGLARGGNTFVVARLEVNYLSELHWPGSVTIGTGVERIGRSSIVFAQAVFAGGRCAASGRSTLVLVDGGSRRPTRLPDDLLQRLQPLRLG